MYVRRKDLFIYNPTLISNKQCIKSKSLKDKGKKNVYTAFLVTDS